MSEYKWRAMDEDGNWYIYTNKPRRVYKQVWSH